jgi:hypothetical protein
MRSLLLFTVLATVGTPVRAQLPDHSALAPVLAQFLEDGLVDYGALIADPGSLDAYLEQLRQPSQAAIDAAPRDVQLAFWINAYNACTMKLVADHYPIQKRGGLAAVVNTVKGYPANSMQQITDTWKREFCEVAGRDRSLDEIEHQIIRPMGEPRIHFAINCAARSCPPLADQPYTPDALDQQLDAAVARFVSDPRHYQVERGDRAIVRVNKVLDWFNDDFGGHDGVLTFLLPYLPDDDRRYVEGHGPARLEFFDYDWTLNDTAVFGTNE